MFHFPGCPPHDLWIQSWVTGHYPRRVSPFGYPWINAYLRLPKAFRSLSRPSSAISAMASTLRSYSLDLFHAAPHRLRQRCFTACHCCFLTSFLCSFQGAHKKPACADPSKRHRVQRRKNDQVAGSSPDFHLPMPIYSAPYRPRI
jgi:hypothetical protein